jgi:predicted RNase H-like HicB family nuclease
MSVRSPVCSLDVIVEQDSDGWLVASVPSLAGCHIQARTRAELRNRVAEAVDSLQVEDRHSGQGKDLTPNLGGRDGENGSLLADSPLTYPFGGVPGRVGSRLGPTCPSP